MPAHSLSVRVERLDPGEPAQSGQCWCPLWRGSWPLTTVVHCWLLWPGRVTRVANIDWRVAPLTSARSTSNTISESHSTQSVQPQLDDPQLTGASNSDFYPECGAPAPLGPDQGRCGGVRSGLLGVARIRAGGWCQIKKGAVRPGADAGTRRRSQLCVEWEMSEEERRPGTGLSK